MATLEEILSEAEDSPGGRGVGVFSDLLAKGIRQGQVPARTDAAREWYRKQAKGIAKSGSKAGVSGDALIQTAGREQGRAKSINRSTSPRFYGEMYTFEYDPKLKGKLPYYDMFPLIFPINKAKGGFLGINFHYLPPTMRAQLMDALYTITNNKSYDESTRLKISYDVLNRASKFRFFKPAIKHYLTTNVRSRLVYINPAEWDIALFLPTARFVGASKQKVYADSRKIIRG